MKTRVRYGALLILGAWLAACAPTYEPACLGDAEHPLDNSALAQPAGLALHGGTLYVANAASISPSDSDFDYCGSFISRLDPASGNPRQAPLLPADASAETADRHFRFFSAITYDSARDVLYVAERQHGSVLKIDPRSGAVVARVAAGHGPFDLRLVAQVPTEWAGEPKKTRDLLFVADLGPGADRGHLYVVDVDDFTFRSAREVGLSRLGKPNALSYDPETFLLYVSVYGATGTNVIDVRTLKINHVSEAPLASFALFTRGTAAATDGTEAFFTAETPSYSGIWQTDARGQLIDQLRLPVPATYLATYQDKLLALARNRLYVIERSPLQIRQTLLLGTATPARLLVDAAHRRAYITSTLPSSVVIKELP